METPAAAPAEGFFPSFLLLACGTLVAALLGAAHRLGLFYQLMHKVSGTDGGGQAKKEGPYGAPSSLLILLVGKRVPTSFEGLVGKFLAEFCANRHTTWACALPLGRHNWKAAAARTRTLPSSPPRDLSPFCRAEGTHLDCAF
jgi:hypothetical protein